MVWREEGHRPFYGIRDFPHYLKLVIRNLKEKSRRESWKFAREVGRQKQPSGLRDCTKFKVGITGLKDHSWGPSWEAIRWGDNAPRFNPLFFHIPFLTEKVRFRECPPPPWFWCERRAKRAQIARVLFFLDLVYATSLLAPATLACKCCCFCQQEPQEDWDQVKLIILSLLRRKKVSRA